MNEKEKFRQINQAALKFSAAIAEISGGKPMVVWSSMLPSGFVTTGLASNKPFELSEVAHIYMAVINELSANYGDAFEHIHHN